eukprot:GSMAST32.ASY1.ANO1.519.1 assembled CDS
MDDELERLLRETEPHHPLKVVEDISNFSSFGNSYNKSNRVSRYENISKSADLSPSNNVTSDIFSRGSSLKRQGGAIMNNILGIEEEQVRSTMYRSKNIPHKKHIDDLVSYSIDGGGWAMDGGGWSSVKQYVKQNQNSTNHTDKVSYDKNRESSSISKENAGVSSLDALLNLTEDWDEDVSDLGTSDKSITIAAEKSAGFGRFDWDRADILEENKDSDISINMRDRILATMDATTDDSLSSADDSPPEPTEMTKNISASRNSKVTKSKKKSNHQKSSKISLKDATKGVTNMLKDAKATSKGLQEVYVSVDAGESLFVLMRQRKNRKGCYVSGFRPRQNGGSPAQNQGVDLGMRVVTINGVDVSQYSIREVVSTMKKFEGGPRVVRFVIPRPDALIEEGSKIPEIKQVKQIKTMSAEKMKDVQQKKMKDIQQKKMNTDKPGKTLELSFTSKPTGEESHKVSSDLWKQWMQNDSSAAKVWSIFFNSIKSIKGNKKHSTIKSSITKALNKVRKTKMFNHTNIGKVTSILLGPLFSIINYAEIDSSSLIETPKKLMNVLINATYRWHKEQTKKWQVGVDGGPPMVVRFYAIDIIHQTLDKLYKENHYDFDSEKIASQYETYLVCKPLNELVRIFATVFLSDIHNTHHAVVHFRDMQLQLFREMSFCENDLEFTCESVPRLLDFVSKGVIANLGAISSNPNHSGFENHQVKTDNANDNDTVDQSEYISIVCNRENSFQGFIKSLQEKGIITDEGRILRRTTGCLRLRTYFTSSFGNKKIDGHIVEEGEGSGPRKEFFELASMDTHKTWLNYEPISGLVSSRSSSLKLCGNELSSFDTEIKPRDRLQIVTLTNVIEVEVQRIEDSRSIFFCPSDEAENLNVVDAKLMRSRSQIPLLRYIKECESFWLNPKIQRNEKNTIRYTCLGIMLASTISSRCTVNMKLNSLLFRHLIGTVGRSAKEFRESLQFEDLVDFNNDISIRVLKVLELPKSQYDALMKLEGFNVFLPREAYAQHICRQVIMDGVEWQLDAITYGFQRSLGNYIANFTVLRMNENQLSKIICGLQTNSTTDFDFRDVFRVIEDAELVSDDNIVLRKAFWKVVTGLSPKQKRKFLKFVTGIARLPFPGTELLRIEMPFITYALDEHQAQMNKMPTAHTCTNTLDLPNYWSSLIAISKAENRQLNMDILRTELVTVLRTKIITAIENSVGYGLDDIDEF